MGRAKLYLIPNLLGENVAVQHVIPSGHVETIKKIRHFAVEHIKDARRLLVRLGLKELIDQSEFFEINKHSDQAISSKIIQQALTGHDIGIISDAGCPGIADPGAELVSLAHQNKIQVVPLVGPSSILLALIASGFNGQSFAFTGYLERDKNKRIQAIKELESQSMRLKQTQLFMETPYRNEALFEDLIQHLNGNTQLSIACDISLDTEFIRTQRIADWKKSGKPNLNKRPAIFSILAY